MKLTDLEPRWFKDTKGNRGISFLCPHCKEQRLGVLVDHAPAHVKASKEQCWQITGDKQSINGMNHSGFDNVTLSPSVDASESGHWHGFIRNGEIC